MSESHREKRKYRGTGFLLAASLVGTGAIIGLSSPAVAQSTAETPIVGDKPDTAGNGLMNYAINLSEDSTDADLQTAQDAVEDLDAELLHSWNQIHVFFAQSDDDKFGTNVAEALDKAGVALDSVGPTRQAPVEDYEVIADTDDSASDTQALRRKVEDANTEGQFEKERKLEAAADDDAESWGVQAIGADEARDVDVKKEKVVVGILDSGVESSHPDLKDSFSEDLSVDCAVNGIPSQDDRANGEKAWYPDLGDTGDYHGMHVNGTVASTNSGIGVAPDATAASVRVYQGDFANPEHVTCGFMWAGEHNFDVTNNSYYVDPWEHWLENEPQQAAGLESVTRAVKWSQDQGVLHVAAAGNEESDLDNITGDEGSPNDVDEESQESRTFEPGDNPMDIPTMFPGVLSVSAAQLPTNADPKTAQLFRASFSNYGETSVDVAAPGRSITSTVPGDKYGTISGTSMASPHVAGVAALLKSVHPDLSNDEITELLKKQAGYLRDRLDADKDAKAWEGAGLVNALDAVLKDQPKPTIGDLEYSTDGGKSWAAIGKDPVQVDDGAKVKLRLQVTGPVTKATLSESSDELDAGEADGAFDGSVALATEITVKQQASSQQALAADNQKRDFEIAAFGRNNDERADDDVTETKSVTFEVAQDSETPGGGDEPGDGEQPGGNDGNDGASNGDSDNSKTVPVVDKTDDKSLAHTGQTALPLIVLALALALAGAGTLTLRQRRAHRE